MTVPLTSPNRPRNSFRSSNTRFLPRSMNASNFAVKAAMRWRRSSKLISTRGSWVRAESVSLRAPEFEPSAFVDARRDELLVENAVGRARVDAICVERGNGF